jgi:hypothetical protein
MTIRYHISSPRFRTKTGHYHIISPHFHTKTILHHIILPHSRTETMSHHIILPHSRTETTSHHIILPHSHTKTMSHHIILLHSRTEIMPHHIISPLAHLDINQIAWKTMSQMAHEGVLTPRINRCNAHSANSVRLCAYNEREFGFRLFPLLYLYRTNVPA